MTTKSYDTLVEALNDLRSEGYVEDFNLRSDCLECREGAYRLFHDDFQVDAVYRFEGMTDPGDSSILFAISSEKFGLKGVLVNAYGAYSEDIAEEMALKLNRA